MQNANTYPPEPGLTTRGVITRVIDGDTVDVQISRVLRVRLLDCWAPETRSTDPMEKALGRAAREHLTELAEGRFCLLHIPADERGRVSDVFTFGRVLGRLWVTPGDWTGDPSDLIDVAAAMVEAGLATVSKPKPEGE